MMGWSEAGTSTFKQRRMVDRARIGELAVLRACAGRADDQESRNEPHNRLAMRM
jgi:hypothetical protein